MAADYLYALVIRPLELLLELLFSVSYRLTDNLGISVIVLGIVLNILILPIYVRADKIAFLADEKERAMRPVIKRIRENFRGDERFMLLQAYYRENDYSPLSVLGSSLSLLLEIPFFIAGFHLLSNLQILKGVSFLFINDLGSPDNIFSIGSFPVNILPILMTLINVVSSMIYTRDSNTRVKVQTYLLAVLFLVLLYNSPAGLVLYWTTNNLFSLVKNIIMKTPAGKAFSKISFKLPAAPFLSGDATSKDHALTFTSLLFTAVITGLLVPTDVVSTSIDQFVDYKYPQNPCFFVFYSLFIAIGMFVLWGGVIYYMLEPHAKRVFSFAVSFIPTILCLDYFAFGTPGSLSPQFRFLYGFVPPEKFSILLNIVSIILVILLLTIIYKNRSIIIRYAVAVELAGVIILSAVNVCTIADYYKDYSFLYHQRSDVEIGLSTTGRNVIVIMLDKGMSNLFPYILEEDPSLVEKFDGFTYYPNTLSFGNATNTGSPALYGGYGYTPEQINSRTSVSLTEEQNNALSVMPVLFYENGFDVTVCDPTYANYHWVPDLSVFDAYPGMKTYITDGKYNDYLDPDSLADVWKRQFFSYGFYRLSPLFMREYLYDNGMYNAADRQYAFEFAFVSDDPETSMGYSNEFLNAYTVMNRLSSFTVTTSDPTDTFLMMSNNTAHNECLLQLPDYVPSYTVDNRGLRPAVYDELGLESETQITHYMVNACAVRGLAEWFDTLRELGVYDNTRIIIVADHGHETHDLSDLYDGAQPELFNPLLLVKDFNSEGFTVSDEFMTNADTPYIASMGLVNDQIDPMTGERLMFSDEITFPVRVTYNPVLDIDDNYGNTFIPGDWYNVYGDIYDPGNWEYAGRE